MWGFGKRKTASKKAGGRKSNVARTGASARHEAVPLMRFGGVNPVVQATDGSLVEIEVPEDGKSWPQGRVITVAEVYGFDGCDPSLGKRIGAPGGAPVKTAPQTARKPARGTRAGRGGVARGFVMFATASGCVWSGLMLAGFL